MDLVTFTEEILNGNFFAGRYLRMVLGGERVASLFILYNVRYGILFRLWSSMSNTLVQLNLTGLL